MNPDTNRFEPLAAQDKTQAEELDEQTRKLQAQVASMLVRPDGSPVPPSWTVLTVGQLVTVEGYTFEVAHIGEQHLLLVPKGPIVGGP